MATCRVPLVSGLSKRRTPEGSIYLPLTGMSLENQVHMTRSRIDMLKGEDVLMQSWREFTGRAVRWNSISWGAALLVLGLVGPTRLDSLTDLAEPLLDLLMCLGRQNGMPGTDSPIAYRAALNIIEILATRERPSMH